MNKVTALPMKLKKKIIKGIRDQKFANDFYNNLDGIANDQIMKELFLNEFPESKPPKY